jgi:hypothetical protein
MPFPTYGRTFVATAALVVLFPLSSSAQVYFYDTVFRADLTGGQVVPPSGSAATGFGNVTLPENRGNVYVTIWSELAAVATAAHVHGPAGPGETGPVLFSLSCYPAWGCLSAMDPVSGPMVAQLIAGQWYLDIHTASYPDGEIRGPLTLDAPLIANLTGMQPVPPSGSAGGGSVKVSTGPRGEIWIYGQYRGLVGNNTGWQLRGPAAPGANGPVLVPFLNPGGGGGGVWFTPGTNPALKAQLLSGLTYVDVQTTAFPSGEVRGQVKPANKPVDFDADARAELAVVRLASYTWFTLNQGTGAFSAVPWGFTNDVLTPGDFDGDGKTDVAIWRPASGTFYARSSTTGAMWAMPWGLAGDDARFGADFDGDGRADAAVFRPGSPAIFYIRRSVNGAFDAVPFGLTGDVTVSGDYDGDRRSDVAVYRPGSNLYYVLASSQGFIARPWGDAATDVLVPGDYDGDAKTDFAVWRGIGAGATGVWYILQSGTGTMRALQFGIGNATDVPAPADYDGDGKTDIAIVRGGAGVLTWYILRSLDGTLQALPFGLAGSDQVVQTYLIR